MKAPRSHLSYAKVSESENPECARKEFRTSRTLAVPRVLCYDLHSTRRRTTTRPSCACSRYHGV